ncbi:UbiH/UbiF family hydroxylase [Brucellaceae bacterium C25G]
MEHSQTRDIIINGSGPAGMMAALALTGRGYHVTLIGPETDKNDRRTTALMNPAIKFLETINVWDAIRPKAAALSSMRIIDGTKRLVRSPTVTFRASELGEDTFGFNILNADLNEALSSAVANDTRIDRIFAQADSFAPESENVELTLSNGEKMNTRLLIAADGRNSGARDAAGIRTRRWSYPQTAVVLCFSHERPHENISTEFHTETGPFTQVPLQGNRSSLVWVVNPDQATQLLTMNADQLAREVEKRMQFMLGSVTVETIPQAWPLSGLVPHVFAAKRTILIGEAAHVFPPIGAQGLNLGTRDIETVLKALRTDISDPGSKRVIRQYDRLRRPDILARTGSVDALNRSLLSPMLPAQIARNLGLEMLRNFMPLRSFFMREGLRPGSGFSNLLPAFPKRKLKG